MGVKHAVLPDGHPPTVAFTQMSAQMCDPKANEREMDAALLARNSEGRNFDFDFYEVLESNRDSKCHFTAINL